ncbi:MAG: NPCBM/NEW2 domain-containing protein [Pirellulaceae bacterium]|nr:NPCBM/NEW2 domain-containing protein [Pirellulaceae bacterium]
MPPHFAVLSLTLAALAADAKVVPLAGAPLEGKLSAVSGAGVTIETGSGPRTIPAADLLAIEFPSPAKPVDKPTLWIDLLDGSQLLADGYAAADGKSTIDLVGGPSLEVPTRSIATVRFRQQDDDLAEQWRAIVTGKPAGDLLVVRKTSMRTIEDGDNEPKVVTEVALDELDGTILSVGPDSVQFEFDGDRLDVKREKIEGLVYFYPVKRELPAAVCRLTDASGSQWAVRALELRADKLALTTAAGAPAELPLSFVAKIDFSVGNIAFLAELAPDTGGPPVLSLQPKEMQLPFSSILKIKPPPARLGGDLYGHVLKLHSPQSLVFRVPPEFRQFHAVAGVDDSLSISGRCVLRILGDGRELFRQEFSAPAARGPAKIALDLAGIKRITIALDAADGQDIGDQLNLCEARFTK